VAVLSAPGPDGRPYTVKLDWSNQDSGDSGSSNGPEAQLPTGEGTVDVTAVVHFPEIIDLNQDFHAAQTVSSSTKTVTVECDDDPDGNPGGGDGGDGGNGGNGGGAVDPDVRSASPNFTG